MPEYIYRLTVTRPDMLGDGPTADEERVVGEHFAYLAAAAAKGHVRLAGRTLTTDADTHGIVVFAAEDEDAARAFMENDPAVRQGVMTARLWPFRTALPAPDGV